MRLFFHKLAHWEYWPFFPVYFPVILQWIYYSLKTRSIFFFNASNPTIRNGGFMAESKIEIYGLMPDEFYPKTVFIPENATLSEADSLREKSGIQYPLFAKPDIGLRGSGVRKIHNADELAWYHRKADFDYLMQDTIPYPNECGIFYVRFPGQTKGKITGIVRKELIAVVGNGKSTIEELVKDIPRYSLQMKAIRREVGEKLSDILPEGERKVLIPCGNHARGAKFLDETYRLTPELTETIDAISQQIPGFYFGRLDIMYDTFEDLERGENFQLVEINGAASEPTHIYDPKHSIFFAWKELVRHTRYMYQISVANHKAGTPYLAHKAGMEQYRVHLNQSKKIVDF